MKTKARPFAVIDCETDPFEKGVIPRPFIWGYYNGDEYHEFTNEADLYEFLMFRNEIVYAHNGGKFDFHYLLDYLNTDEKIMVIGGRIVKAKMGACELRDSYAILPVSLSTFSKMKFDYNKMKKENRKKHMKEIRTYLRDDCEQLYEFVSRFREEYGAGVTIAGTALKLFYKMRGGKAPETSNDYFEAYSPYYAGGRVSCFEGGVIKAPFKIADINSAYPAAMMQMHANGKDFTFSRDERAIIDQSFVKLRARGKGCFYRKDKGLHFDSDGELRDYFVTGWEYNTAKELGLFTDCEIICVQTPQTMLDFKDYVSHFYDMKAEAKRQGDKARYIFAKLFMNSLYGKYAANPNNYKNNLLINPDDLEGYESADWQFSSECGARFLMQQELPDFEKRFYNVATAASITGCVRAMMLRAINSVERPLYCDTDSIFFAGNHSLDIGEKLGQWDIEGEGDSLAIAGKKLYSARLYGGSFKTASKGAILCPQDIYAIANGEIKDFTPIVPTYSFKKGIFFITRKIQKTI